MSEGQMMGGAVVFWVGALGIFVTALLAMEYGNCRQWFRVLLCLLAIAAFAKMTVMGYLVADGRSPL